MRVGFFRRLTAFLVDTMPIILTLSLLLSLFVGDLLKSEYPNYEEDFAIYQENLDVYYTSLTGLGEQRDEETITSEEYTTQSTDLREDFNTVNADYSSMILAYYLNVVLYFFISYSIINYFYNLILKGQTFGRRFMKIELYGKITWFTLLLREFLWKPVFWLFTFSAGIAIDIGLILFTKKKKTIRDYLSDTELRFTGISYPF